MGLTAYQAHMKRELKGKMKGKTAAQRKAIFKAAAASYRKSGSRRPVSVQGTRSYPVSRLAKLKSRIKSTGGNHRTSKGGFNTNKLFKWVRVGALVLPAAKTITSPMSNAAKLSEISRNYFAYNPDNKTFNLGWLLNGWGPYAAANAVTYGIPKLISIIRGM